MHKLRNRNTEIEIQQLELQPVIQSIKLNRDYLNVILYK